MNRYEKLLITIQTHVVCAKQASILTNIYASMIMKPFNIKYYHVFRKAIEQSDECPITLEKLDISSLVTSCGHVFSKGGLLSWIHSKVPLSIKHVIFDCPLCKQKCSVIFPLSEI